MSWWRKAGIPEVILDQPSRYGRARADTYQPVQLRNMLLSDHQRNRADTLGWMLAAVTVIAHRERKTVEDIWTDLNGEAHAKTGRRMSPFMS